MQDSYLREKILARIDPGDLAELAASLVRIPSHYGVAGGETEVAGAVSEFLVSKGIESYTREVFDGRSNVYGKLAGKKDGPNLLFCGHTDTVPGEDMQHPAYEGLLREGRLWGRGAADMKGGLAAMLMAVAALKGAGLEMEGNLIFAGVVAEESPYNSQGAKALLNDYPQLDWAVVGEPTELKVAFYHKGMSWFTVRVKGKASHASKPDDGINSISVAARIIDRLERELLPELATRSHSFVGMPTLNIGKIEGGKQNNIVPENCRIFLDRRTVPGEKIKEVLEEIEKVVKNVTAEYPGAEYTLFEQEETCGRIPLESGPGILAQQLSRAGTSVTGSSLDIGGVDYWTDGARLYNAGAETAVFGPGSIAQAHGSVEYIDIEQLLKASRIYALTAMSLLGSKGEGR